MHGAPRRTILGLRTYENMGLYFTGKKSNLTGLCEIWNNFDLKTSENSQKLLLIMKNFQWQDIYKYFLILSLSSVWPVGLMVAFWSHNPEVPSLNSDYAYFCLTDSPNACIHPLWSIVFLLVSSNYFKRKKANLPNLWSDEIQ